MSNSGAAPAGSRPLHRLSETREDDPSVAHVRGDKQTQPLLAHLYGVAGLASQFAAKFGLSTQGELIGLLRDLGKYSAVFQAYMSILRKR